MFLSFLIDGYNLIHALGLLRKVAAPTELESSRRRLLSFLHERLEPRADSITVVFDAKRRPRRLPPEDTEGCIVVCFAGRNEEADDRIETLLAEHPTPRRLVIVSDDRRLQDAAARRHAHAWGCQDLLDHLDRKPTAAAPNNDAAAGQPRLSEAEVQEWLREFHDVELPDEFRDFLEPDPQNE